MKIERGPAARDFGGGQGGEAGASPLRAATAEPTPATGKRPAARRVFEENAVCLRYSSVTDPWRVCSLVTPRHPALENKTPLNFQTGSYALLRFRSHRNHLQVSKSGWILLCS